LGTRRSRLPTETAAAAALSVGNRLRLVPNHACVSVATQPHLHLVNEDSPVDTWPVAGRHS